MLGDWHDWQSVIIFYYYLSLLLSLLLLVANTANFDSRSTIIYTIVQILIICWLSQKKNGWTTDDQNNPVFTLHLFAESDTLLYHSVCSSKARKLWNINGQHGRFNIELCLCSNICVAQSYTHTFLWRVLGIKSACHQLSCDIHSTHNLFVCLSLHASLTVMYPSAKHSSKFSASLVGQSVSNPLQLLLTHLDASSGTLCEGQNTLMNWANWSGSTYITPEKKTTSILVDVHKHVPAVIQ